MMKKNWEKSVIKCNALKCFRFFLQTTITNSHLLCLIFLPQLQQNCTNYKLNDNGFCSSSNNFSELESLPKTCETHFRVVHFNTL